MGSRKHDSQANGALPRAVYGREAIPAQWGEKGIRGHPQQGAENVHAPRREVFWPVDALELAARLP